MSTTATPLAGTFASDPVHSSFGFAVKYQGISIFRGTLDDVTATLVDGKLEGTAKVESISIRTPEQFRAHVLSDDFFAADKYPEVTFVSDDVELNEDGTATRRRRADDPRHDADGHRDRHVDRSGRRRLRQHPRAPAARDGHRPHGVRPQLEHAAARPAATRWPTTSR